jgi:hypothetical protein
MYVAILLVVVLDLCGNLLLEKMDALCLTPIFCQIGSLKSMLFYSLLKSLFVYPFLECREMEKPHQGDGLTKF